MDEMCNMHGGMIKAHKIWLSRIWGSHGGEYEDCCLLGCDRPEDGGSKDLWNVGKLLPDYTVLQPRRQQSSQNILSENLKREYHLQI
jgi:hypothetical protein